MRAGAGAALAAALLLPAPAWAQATGQELATALPAGALRTVHREAARETYRLPVGPWEAGKMPALDLDGMVADTAWRIPGSGPQTAGLMADIRERLELQGFTPIFACAADACGGFDFRYRLTLLAEPEMHVDLTDFRFASAIRGNGDTAEYLAVMVSRAGDTGFVQITSVAPPGMALPDPPATAGTTPAAPEPATAPPQAAAAGSLDRDGHIILQGVSFAPGAVVLPDQPYPALEDLARFLHDNPETRVIIVGHTDSTGGLAANIAVSRQRARAVADRLVADYGVAPSQIEAEGAGPLAPVATNATEAGREKNRRVEAVLASTR